MPTHVLIVLFVLFGLWFCRAIYKNWRGYVHWSQAQQFHDDMFNKIRELRDDPSISDAKWREWLPLCRFSDDLLRQCSQLPFCSLEQMVQEEIEPDSYPSPH